ncbi:hypothetical protein GGS24DRAFT_507121 [Hypoxylon argillaceum]|nr:hypothetical protein GGS24DRAFT_507121 [Hypoxylon argillaceum]
MGMLEHEAEITCQQSIVLRRRGEVECSRRTIETFLLSPHITSAEISSENFVALYLSQALNHIYAFRFSEAHTELEKWAPGNPLTEWQGNLVWEQVFSVGRVMRGEGRFEEAAVCFEICLRNPELSKLKKYLA